MDTIAFARMVAAMTQAEAAALYLTYRERQEDDYQHMGPRARSMHALNVAAKSETASRRLAFSRVNAEAIAEHMEADMDDRLSGYDELVFRKSLLAIRRGSYDQFLHSPTAGVNHSMRPAQDRAATLVADARRDDPVVVVPPEPPPYLGPPTWRVINNLGGGQWLAAGRAREEVEAHLAQGAGVRLLQERSGNDWRTVVRVEA